MPRNVVRDRFFWQVAFQTVAINMFLGGFGPSQGLLREDQGGYRFLFSPLLKFNKIGPFYQYYTGDLPPRIIKGHENQVLWKHKGTNYYFRIERMTRYEIFGSLRVPVRSLLRRNKLL
jgi:hypothetical protein